MIKMLRHRFSAKAKAWAMLVKPFFCCMPSRAVFTDAKSDEIVWTFIAGDTVTPSGMMMPFPNSTRPTFIASWPKLAMVLLEQIQGVILHGVEATLLN